MKFSDLLQWSSLFNLKDPASFLIGYIFSLYQGLKARPSDLETDDIPMCHVPRIQL